MRRPRSLLVGPCVAALGACAAEGGPDGGQANLPDRGISGWTRAPNEPPPSTDHWAASVADAELGGPSAVVVGDRVLLYAHRTTADGAELVRLEGDADGLGFGAPVALELDGTDPSVFVDGATTWLAWVAGDDIALARSDDGVTFEPLAPSGIAPGRGNPSVIVADGRVHLYLSDGTRVVHSEAGDDLAFGAETAVLEPGTDCVDTQGEPEPCWDNGAILDAEVRLATTPTGRALFRMFYAARAAGRSDLGFAASYDGLTFSRYPYNPIYVDTFDERSPSAILSDGVYYLFWGETRAATDRGIARAFHVPSAPADRW